MNLVTGSHRRGVAYRLDRLFDRRNDRWGARSSISAVRTLAPLIETGRLSMRLRRLPLDACLAARHMQVDGRGESRDHIRMKRAAREWMRAEGASDAREEVPGYSGKFDAYSAKADWVVECGNSDAGKLIDAIRDDECPRFTLIPYQDTERHDGSPRRLIAVDFVWNDALCGDLNDAALERDRAASRANEQSQRARMIAEAQARKAAREA